ncbi:hypothetical protein ACFYXS_37475 [Streptomyces sp. NPDC002574]|uniref:hypothetical protein n=1 Tax=Streptomyces sp. NPDC002574 TaxID=3364652 RepID=UPI00369F4A4D
MINKLIREEVRRFPVLTPPGGWQSDTLDDLLGDFLTDRLEKVTANLLALASSDDSVAKLLRKSIRHWLIDKARQTALGSLRRQLEKVLTSDDAFEAVPPSEDGAGRWRLAGVPTTQWSGSVEDLVEAARAVENVTVPKWSSETRRAPVAARESIVAVTYAVLSAAKGSLEVAQLVEVFAARFPIVLDPVVLSLAPDGHSENPSYVSPSAEDVVVAAESEVDALSAAGKIVDMLSPQERQLVPHLDNLAAVRDLIGCGRTQAYHHVARLGAKLDQLVGDADDVRSVGLEVIRLCGGPVEAG